MLNTEGLLERKTENLPLEALEEAVRYLERQGATVLTIRRLPYWLNPVVQAYMHGFSRIKRAELAEMFNSLAVLLGARVNVLTALNEVSQGIKNPRLLSIVNFIIVDISNGQTFSKAIARHGRTFSPIICQMARIGEETGTLDQMLRKVADYLRQVDHVVGETKRALIYPALVLLVISGAVIFWLWYVVPQIVELFHEFGVEVPDITRFLIFMSSLVQNWMGPAVVFALFSAALLMGLRRLYRPRYAMDWLILKMPVISGIIHASSVARITENLGVLTASGVTVLRSLEIIRDSIENEVIKKRFEHVEHEIILGNNLSGALKRASAVEAMVVRMIAAGEATSSLEQQAFYVARQYRQRLDYLVQNMSKVLEPALLIVMGLFFALIVAGLLFPLYEMIGDTGMI
ncbi:type II secretion system F family protein [Desulfonatronospira thiodismutans]|nr:type II secretion system F family protein [Desulfonatronospira thiodismutans]